ncbi:hypothetical protein IF1G_08948 [Cordyceps javanica]|uniref:Uncharacterized protein n=1 Tax=Cordyceps javanica TaxID=43265 RepID=A0A545USK7_9HYPO|nr:hypothetical protein IF1G_08948 [Cordyceps javanica]
MRKRQMVGLLYLHHPTLHRKDFQEGIISDSFIGFIAESGNVTLQKRRAVTEEGTECRVVVRRCPTVRRPGLSTLRPQGHESNTGSVVARRPPFGNGASGKSLVNPYSQMDSRCLWGRGHRNTISAQPTWISIGSFLGSGSGWTSKNKTNNVTRSA